MPDYVLAEASHDAVRSHEWQAAVLPFGATEPHNLHLPYGTDVFQVDALARAACGHAWDRGAKVLCLPPIPFGVNTNHFGVPGGKAISLCPSTLLAILRDAVESLERQGVRKLVLLNGHGANELKPLVRELYHRTPVFLCVCDLFRLAADVRRRVVERPGGDHADEVETSLMLALRQDLVRLDKAGPGATRPSRFKAVNEGWVSLTRPWHLLTADTGAGDPSKGTAEKGRAILDAMTAQLGGFLAELAASPMDETFPMSPE